jgi:hypothetical protein
MNEPQECGFASKCLGATCAPGYEKVLCDTCAAHFFSAPGKKCFPCSDKVIFNFYFVLASAIVCFLCVLVHTWRNPIFWEHWMSDTFSYVSQALIGTHVQRLVLLNSLALPFPHEFKVALDWAARLVLNGVVGPECFTDQWSFRLFWSLVVGTVAALIVLTVIMEAAREFTRQCERQGQLLPALAETWAKIYNTHEIDHSVDHFWRGMRLNPLMSAMRFVGSGVLLQVSFKALAFKMVSGVRRQAGDVNANYDAPDYLPILFFSWIVVILAFFAIIMLTLLRYKITTDRCCVRNKDVKVEKGVLVVEKFPTSFISVAGVARSPTGTDAYNASLEIQVLKDPTPWALHIFDMANIFSAISLVPKNMFDKKNGNTISACLLLVIDILAFSTIAGLFACRSPVSSSDRVHPFLVLVSLLAIMTQSVAVWCIVNASDADGTCGMSLTATVLGWALSVLNGGFIVALGGYMAMRMCCCRVLYCPCAVWGGDCVASRFMLPCGGVEDECCCSFGGRSWSCFCAHREAPEDSAKKQCPLCCWRGRRCGGNGPPLDPAAQASAPAVPVQVATPYPMTNNPMRIRGTGGKRTLSSPQNVKS